MARAAERPVFPRRETMVVKSGHSRAHARFVCVCVFVYWGWLLWWCIRVCPPGCTGTASNLLAVGDWKHCSPHRADADADADDGDGDGGPG